MKFPALMGKKEQKNPDSAELKESDAKKAPSFNFAGLGFEGFQDTGPRPSSVDSYQI